LLVLVFLPEGFACANTRLAAPESAASNPEAHSMPIPDDTSSLDDNFDPWAGQAVESADSHAGHQATGEAADEAVEHKHD
jgi:hypothetical protein